MGITKVDYLKLEGERLGKGLMLFRLPRPSRLGPGGRNRDFAFLKRPKKRIFETLFATPNTTSHKPLNPSGTSQLALVRFSFSYLLDSKSEWEFEQTYPRT